jgi:hypothetical protein
VKDVAGMEKQFYRQVNGGEDGEGIIVSKVSISKEGTKE